jgi:hypothetical protein
MTLKRNCRRTDDRDGRNQLTQLRISFVRLLAAVLLPNIRKGCEEAFQD